MLSYNKMKVSKGAEACHQHFTIKNLHVDVVIFLTQILGRKTLSQIVMLLIWGRFTIIFQIIQMAHAVHVLKVEIPKHSLILHTEG